MKYNISKGMTPQIAQLLEIPRHPEPKTWRQNILDAVDTTRRERDEAQSQLGDITKVLVEAGLMKRNVNSSVESLIEIATAPDATQPQLSEIRYVLHGDIQPCSVLYSDDTTTLLRLDEGDMMLETDTIEWSDSVTYRCQELLKGESKRSNIPVTLAPVKLLAQLVRDERILLNDDALETSGTVDLKVDSDIGVGQPVVQVRKPDATDIPFMRHSLVPEHSIEQPCDECSHVFSADSMTCPMCNTIRPSKQER